MSVITERNESLRVFEKAAERGTSIGIFCTASYWNTEALLIAAQRIAEKYQIEKVPVVVATTFTYPHMPQCRRFLYCQDPKTGILSHFAYLNVLAGSKYSPYKNVAVLPHLDHANPVRDRWALTCALPYFSSVMFDAQLYPFEENMALTAEYVKNYGNDVLVEGILESLNVSDGAVATHIDNYCENAVLTLPLPTSEPNSSQPLSERRGTTRQGQESLPPPSAERCLSFTEPPALQTSRQEASPPTAS